MQAINQFGNQVESLPGFGIASGYYTDKMAEHFTSDPFYTKIPKKSESELKPKEKMEYTEVRRKPPQYITEKQRILWKKIMKRAWYHDRNFCGCTPIDCGCGMVTIISSIPILGSIIAYKMHYKMIKMCGQAGCPPKLLAAMAGNAALDFTMTLIPLLGVLLSWMKASSTRNAGIFDDWLRGESEKHRLMLEKQQNQQQKLQRPPNAATSAPQRSDRPGTASPPPRAGVPPGTAPPRAGAPPGTAPPSTAPPRAAGGPPGQTSRSGQARVPPGNSTVPGQTGRPGQTRVPPGNSTVPGQTHAPQGQPSVPTGQTRAPQGQPSAPTSQVRAPQGQLSVPTGQARAPGQPSIPTGQARAPRGQTVPGQARAPQSNPTIPSGYPKVPAGQSGQARAPQGQVDLAGVSHPSGTPSVPSGAPPVPKAQPVNPDVAPRANRQPAKRKPVAPGSPVAPPPALQSSIQANSQSPVRSAGTYRPDQAAYRPPPAGTYQRTKSPPPAGTYTHPPSYYNVQQGQPQPPPHVYNVQPYNAQPYNAQNGYNAQYAPGYNSQYYPPQHPQQYSQYPNGGYYNVHQG